LLAIAVVSTPQGFGTSHYPAAPDQGATPHVPPTVASPPEYAYNPRHFLVKPAKFSDQPTGASPNEL